MRLFLALGLLLLIPSASVAAQSGQRAWEFGPSWRFGRGLQFGAELRRVLPLSRRIDARVGGSAVWRVTQLQWYGTQGNLDYVDGRNTEHVLAANADLRFDLLDTRPLGLSFVHGIGVTYQTWKVVNACDGDVCQWYSPPIGPTHAPLLNFGIGLRIGRRINFDIGADAYPDDDAEILGALRGSMRIRW